MKFVRDRINARWLPSRFQFAIFRLMAFVVMRGSDPGKVRPGVIIAVDRGQSALENYLACALLMSVASTFVFVALDQFLWWGIALVLAPPAAVIILLLLMGAASMLAPVWRSMTRSPDSDNIQFNSAFVLSTLAVASALLAATHSPARVAAWVFLAAAVANVVAAAIMFVLRPAVAEMERRCGL